MSQNQEQSPGLTGFYLMRGGPIYRLMVKLHLRGVENAYVHRRSLVLICVTWVPLLLLSLVQGLALPGAVRIPFLYDFATHILFLVTLPLLIIAEIVVEPAISKSLSEFLDRGLIKEKDHQAFESILAWAQRKCNSSWSELIIAIIALTPFISLRGAHWSEKLAGSWALSPSGEGLSLAGFWMVFVSNFFMRAFLFRWVYRLIIWTRLLGRLGRLDLNTFATHPDRAGGLGFIGEVEMRFGILAFAVGAVASANVAANILFQHTSLRSERLVVIAYVVGASLVFLLPLLALARTLQRTWRKGLREYGELASSYVQQFDRKWVQRGRGRDGLPPSGPPRAFGTIHPDPSETLLGADDIQSLADLGNSFRTIEEMKLLPIGRRHIVVLVLSAAVPMLPLIFLDPWAREIAQKLLERLL